MQVAQRIAGYSLGQADMLRRAMGKKKPEVMAAEKITFTEGAVKQGFTKEHAEDIFEILIPFAGYGLTYRAAYSVVAIEQLFKSKFSCRIYCCKLNKRNILYRQTSGVYCRGPLNGSYN